MNAESTDDGGLEARGLVTDTDARLQSATDRLRVKGLLLHFKVRRGPDEGITGRIDGRVSEVDGRCRPPSSCAMGTSNSTWMASIPMSCNHRQPRQCPGPLQSGFARCAALGGSGECDRPDRERTRRPEGQRTLCPSGSRHTHLEFVPSSAIAASWSMRRFHRGRLPRRSARRRSSDSKSRYRTRFGQAGRLAGRHPCDQGDPCDRFCAPRYRGKPQGGPPLPAAESIGRRPGSG